jgi:hypothetical protein
MTNSNIIKLAGILAVISMLFLPMAGCGTFTFSGLDIIKSSSSESVSGKVAGDIFGVDSKAPSTADNTIKILLIAAIVMGVLVIVVKRKGQAFLASIVGILLLVGAYIYMKSNLSAKSNTLGGLNDLNNSTNNFLGMDASDMIELKSGAYLAVISFLVAAFVAKSKKELISPQSPPADNTTDTNRPPGTN